MPHRKHDVLRVSAIAALSATALFPFPARADDAPGPCAALKLIVAAAPTGFSQLTPDEGKGIAQPDGSDAQCGATKGSYECQWTPTTGGAASSTGALQAVAADIASCLPDAPHDVNSPARQHFYIGSRESRTQITAMPAGASKVKLVVSGK